MELRNRFPAITKVPFQPGLPQFHNVLEFTFKCLLTILQCNETILSVWPQPLPYGSANCCAEVRRWQGGGGGKGGGVGGRRWAAHFRLGLNGAQWQESCPYSGKMVPTNSLKRGKCPCVNLCPLQLPSPMSWFVLIFKFPLGKRKGIFGSLAADDRPTAWPFFFFLEPEVLTCEFPEDRDHT